MRWTRLLRSVSALALVTTVAAVAPATTRAEAATPTINARRVGVSLYGSVLSWSAAKLTHQLDLVQHTGAVWVRVPMDWSTLQMHGRGTFNWAPADRVITEAKRRHLQVMPD